MYHKRPISLRVMSVLLLSGTTPAHGIDCDALHSGYVQAVSLMLGASDSGNESPHTRSTRESANTILASLPFANVVAVRSSCNSETYHYDLFASAFLNSLDPEPYDADLFFGLGEWQDLESQIGRYPGLTPVLFRNMVGRIAANMRAKHITLDTEDQKAFLARWLPKDAVPALERK